VNSDKLQLELVRESIFDPGKAEEAKELLLEEIYREVGNHYRGYASNGGRLVDPRIPDPHDYGFTYNAIRVLMSRYLSRDEYGHIVETPSSLMRRVAKGFEGRVNPLILSELLLSRRFVFNSPTLFNMYVDGAHGTLSACYVTPLYDDLNDIMEATRVQALTFKHGGGQGFNFSNLRPRWSMVRGTGSFSSGPISFMTIFDRVTDAVKQGGKRRGANMGVMHDWHADLYNPYFNVWDAYRYMLPAYARAVATGVKGDLESQGCKVNGDFEEHTRDGMTPPEEAGFIQAKRFPLGDLFLTNFNISVGIHDAFFEALFEGREWWLVNPQLTGEVGPGDYRISYAVSRATGIGMLGEILDKVETPYISILEDMVEHAKKNSVKILEEAGMSWDSKNPYIWHIPTSVLWEEIISSAWSTGDPGLLFLDNYNKWNPTPWLGTIGVTNPCVSGDTRMLTPEGWKKARDIWEEARQRGIHARAVSAGEDVLGEGGELTAYETRLVVPDREVPVYVTSYGDELALYSTDTVNAWVWHVGRKPGLRVVTREGYEAVVTHEHKFLTPEGWKRADQLKPGDKVMVARLHPEHARGELSSGVRLEPDVAFALGWLIGDGTLNEYYVAWYFGPQDGEALERVKRAILRLGANPNKYLRRHGSEQVVMVGKNTRLYKKIIELMGGTMLRQPERRLPEIVWRLDFESLAMFLRGLFTADGTVDNDRAVRLTSSSLGLLKDVQVLLTALGVFSRIYNRPYRKTIEYTTSSGEKRVYEFKGYYELVINGYSRKIFAEIVGFESTGKSGKLVLKKAKRDSVWATVKAVGDAGMVDFYDFTVPGYKRYIAGGLVHHNCGEQYLYYFESCNLGSMSVEKYADKGMFDLDSFYLDVQTVMDAMDAVIDRNRHPHENHHKANSLTRKVGLGMMGLADLLSKLGLPYDSEEAVAVTLILTAAINVYAWKRSWELGAELGPAPAFKCKVYDWRRMECVKPGNSDELLEMHIPALKKVASVVKFEDGWLKLKYHDVSIPGWVYERLTGASGERVEPDGTVKLVSIEALENVAENVFGITRKMADDALTKPVEEVVGNPRLLLALAVWRPGDAWRVLVEYGRSIGAVAPRNTVVNTVAPTGSISIIAGTSSGIEPYFALVFQRNVSVGSFLEVVSSFRDDLLELARNAGVGRDVIGLVFDEVSKHKGSLRWALPDIEAKLSGKVGPGFILGLRMLADMYSTSMDFDYWYHLAHNAAAQLYTDQSISKTVNLRKDATKQDVETVYILGWLLGLRGVTIYRDESKMVQVIDFGASGRTGDKRFVECKRRSRLVSLPKKNGGDGSVLVMGETENSTCKTCEL